jgi:hypothetical protein
MHNDLKCRKAHKFVHPPNRPPSHGILDPGIAVTIGQGASICEAVPNTTPTFQTFRKTIPKTKSTFQNFRGTVFQYFYSRPWASALRSKHTILFFVVITHLSSREFCAPTHSNLSSYRMLGNNQFQTVAPPSASGVDLLLRNYAAICCFFSLGGLAAMFFQQIFNGGYIGLLVVGWVLSVLNPAVATALFLHRARGGIQARAFHLREHWIGCIICAFLVLGMHAGIMGQNRSLQSLLENYNVRVSSDILWSLYAIPAIGMASAAAQIVVCALAIHRFRSQPGGGQAIFGYQNVV